MRPCYVCGASKHIVAEFVIADEVSGYMTRALGVSFVVPVYAGRNYLESLVAAIEAVKDVWETTGAPVRLTELILVDDAAIDGSGALIDRLATSRRWITALHLSRNFGQHAATMAGILHTSGDWVVTLDEDLQHRPERVEDFLRLAALEGHDVVYARPASGIVHGKAWRDVSSRRVKRLMAWLTGTPTLHLINSFRLIRGPIARATASVCTHNTYFDIALTWFTQRIAGIEIEMRDDRFAETGRSGYDLGKLIAHAQRMLFSSQLRYLSLGIWIGAGLFLIAFVTAAYFAVLRLVTPEMIGVEGWTSLFVAVCGSAGIVSAMLGLCLQYLSTLVMKAHGRPMFFTVDRSADRFIAEWSQQRLARKERTNVG